MSTDSAFDLDIQCLDCGDTFTWTEKEQRFYQEKGFTEPKRCRACRTVRKQNFRDREGRSGSDRGTPDFPHRGRR
jgi:hypothetical protein